MSAIRIYGFLFLVSLLMLFEIVNADRIRVERDFYHLAALRALGLAKEAADMADKSNAIAEQYRKEVIFLMIKKRIEIINDRAPSARIALAILKSSEETGIDPYWLTAVIEQESHYHVNAVGMDGERGLAQIMHSTATEIGLEWNQAFDIEMNVEAGARYLAQHYETTGSMRSALVRYNGDPEYATLVSMREKKIRNEVYRE